MSDYPKAIRFCDLDDTPVKYRIAGLLTEQGKFIISAYQKAGKTTLALHLLAALDTGEDFLGRHTSQLRHPWLYINLELPQNMLKKYAADAGLDLESRQLFVADFCGQEARLLELLTEPDCMDGQELFDRFEGVVIDPLSSLLAVNGVSSDDNDEVRALLQRVEATLREHGVTQIGIVDHTGHADKSRSRGASAKGDWADIMWNYQREPDQSVGTLTTVGRGIMPETICFRKDGAQLVVTEGRSDARRLPGDEFARLRQAEAEHPEMSVRDLASLLDWDKSKISRMRKDARYKI